MSETENYAALKQKADQGDAGAQLNLGLCYDNGRGVERDPVKAAEWYRKAADQGNADAQVNLGVCCAKGDGVERDLAKAAAWFRKAADQGDEGAKAALAKLERG
jgi:hypothetical protein